MTSLLRNPLTIWASWWLKSTRAKIQNRGKHLRIGYLSNVADCQFGEYVTIYDHVSAFHSIIGDFTFVASESKLHRSKIGKFCSIGPDCKVGLGRHPSSTFVSTHPVFYSTLRQSQVTFSDRDYFSEYLEIEIGNDVWLGTGAVVVDGVTIRDGAVVAAGSIVTKDVPPYAIVGGVPAKLIRYRFSEQQIVRLLENPWWDKEPEYLRANFSKFHDIDEYLSTIG